MIISANADTYISANSGYNVNIRPGGNSSTNQLTISTTGARIGGNLAWHAGNDGSGSGLDADLLDGVPGESFLRSDTADSATGTLTVRDVKFSAGYHLQRSDHHSGHLEGSYNNIGDNSYKSNPIYSIGSNYNPGDAALSNFYGVGYGHTNASFINFTGASAWGFYVAANGAARVNLCGSNGVISSTGQHYVGSNVVWNAGNDGSGSGLDADTLDGLQLGTGRNNSANQVVRTNVHGYIDAGYINTSCDDTGTGVDCKFYASQDDYIRYIDKASMRSVVNSPARSSAYEGRESYTSDTNYWMGAMGNGAANFDSTVWDYGSGAFDVWSNPSGQPSGTSHWCGLQSMHYTNGSARYGMRITCGAGQTALAYIQGRWNTTTYGWHKLWNEGNDGSGSGLDADTVDGIQASSFLRADTSDTVSGGPWQLTNTNSSWAYRFVNSTGTNNSVYMAHGVHGVHIRNDSCTTSGYLLQVYGSNGTDFKVRGGDALATSGGNTMWHAGNDGSGSGLDADLWDGDQKSTYLNQAVLTSSNVTHNNIYSNSWHRNNNSGNGLYNDGTTSYFYSDHDDVYNVAGGSSANWIRFRDEHAGTIRGYVGANNSNVIGFLDYEGNFAFSSGKFTNYSHRDLCSQPDDGHDLGYGNRRWDNVYATNGTIQTSDRNEKENIVATDLGLDFVNKLSPVSFKRKGKTRTHYGFIAQDIEQIITDLGKTTTQFAPLIKSDISEAKDGSEYRYGLRYEQLLAPVVKAIQELAVKVAALESA